MSPKNRLLILVYPVILTIALAACGGTVTVPLSDPTPPFVSLEVLGLGETIYLEESSAPIERTLADPAQPRQIWSFGEDLDGGIHRVSQNVEWTCGSDPSEGSNAGSGWASGLDPLLVTSAPRSQLIRSEDNREDNPDPGQFTIQWFIDWCDFRGYEVSDLRISYTTYGENHHGGNATTAPFIVHFIPEEAAVVIDEGIEIPESLSPTPPGLELNIPSPTPLIPFSISDTSCWEGPGSQYPLVLNLPEGALLRILGVAQTSSWFIVEPADSPDAECWVEMNAVEVDANLDFSSLIVYPIPPLQLPPTEDGDGGPPSSGPPAAPSGLAANTTVCNGGYRATVTWKDNASNEDGYRVYRNGNLIATLGPNATMHVDNPPGSGPHSYYVEAFNNAGAAQSNSDQDDGCLI